MKEEIYCADYFGFGIEWMHHCKKHNTNWCPACSCPDCDDEGNVIFAYDHKPEEVIK